MYTIEELRKECNLLEWCLINAVVNQQKTNEIISAEKTDEHGNRKFDIKLVVNGVDLPLMKTFKDAEKQMDQMILDKAKDLVNERLNEFDSKLDEAYQDFEDKITEIILERV